MHTCCDRSERLAKYNQLLRIEEELGADAIYAGAHSVLQIGLLDLIRHTCSLLHNHAQQCVVHVSAHAKGCMLF